MTKIASKLDWTRMLGFEQVAENREVVGDSAAQLGAKVGTKPGIKPIASIGAKVGVKPIERISAKVGVKPVF